jgi:Domain of unknown function (DUF4351)
LLNGYPSLLHHRGQRDSRCSGAGGTDGVISSFLDWEQKTINTAQKQANESPVLRQLTPRVGEVKPDLLSRVQELSLAQVEALGEAL